MSRSPVTLWLDDLDHHALATLQARYKLSTLSETVCFAIHILTQPLEGGSTKEADEAAIRAEMNTSSALELQVCQTELTDTRTELAHTMQELQQLGNENYTLALEFFDDLAQLHAEVGDHIPLEIDPPSQLRYLHAPSQQRQKEAVALRAKARMLRRQGKAR
jgi:hypothetical protein